MLNVQQLLKLNSLDTRRTKGEEVVIYVMDDSVKGNQVRPSNDLGVPECQPEAGLILVSSRLQAFIEVGGERDHFQIDKAGH